MHDYTFTKMLKNVTKTLTNSHDCDNLHFQQKIHIFFPQNRKRSLIWKV